MIFDLDLIRQVYKGFKEKVEKARKALNRPLTFTEKILYAHLWADSIKEFKRSSEFVEFRPDSVAMQDATAQMALLQFMSAGIPRVKVPTTVHCDHLIQAEAGSKKDLERAILENKEVYDFLSSVSKNTESDSGNRVLE